MVAADAQGLSSGGYALVQISSKKKRQTIGVLGHLQFVAHAGGAIPKNICCRK